MGIQVAAPAAVGQVLRRVAVALIAQFPVHVKSGLGRYHPLHEAPHARHQVAAVVAVGQMDNVVLDCAISADEVIGNGQSGFDIKSQLAAHMLERDT